MIPLAKPTPTESKFVHSSITCILISSRELHNSYSAQAKLTEVVRTLKKLPLFPAGWSHHRGHTLLKQISGPTQIDNVEDHSLVLLNIVHGEVKPEPDSWIAGVRTDEQVIELGAV